MAKGVSIQHKGEEFEKELEQVKWFLWHATSTKHCKCWKISYETLTPK
jgi:hypothetical protein